MTVLLTERYAAGEMDGACVKTRAVGAGVPGLNTLLLVETESLTSE